MRKYGYSKILMKYAEIHTRRFQFDYIKLWCEQDLLDYYKKFGYNYVSKIVNSKGEPVFILMKRI